MHRMPSLLRETKTEDWIYEITEGGDGWYEQDFWQGVDVYFLGYIF